MQAAFCNKRQEPDAYRYCKYQKYEVEHQLCTNYPIGNILIFQEDSASNDTQAVWSA